MGFPVCKKENFAGLEAHRKRGKSARASRTPHHTLNEKRSARFTAQHLSALLAPIYLIDLITIKKQSRYSVRSNESIFLELPGIKSHPTLGDCAFQSWEGVYSHTLPIRVCTAQRGRDFEAPDLERGIHFRGVF